MNTEFGELFAGWLRTGGEIVRRDKRTKRKGKERQRDSKWGMHIGGRKVEGSKKRGRQKKRVGERKMRKILVGLKTTKTRRKM